jgi:hypothetical protein
MLPTKNGAHIIAARFQAMKQAPPEVYQAQAQVSLLHEFAPQVISDRSAVVREADQ